MKNVLIEMMYLAPIEYFALILRAEKILIERHEHFVKATYRNRCHIYGANGLLKLSVPIKHGKRNHASVKEIEISYDNHWQQIHWQSICSAYRSSPWFEFYENELAPFYEKRFQFLWDFNDALMFWVMEKIGIDRAKINFTEQFVSHVQSSIPDNNLLDIRSAIVPQTPKRRTIEGFNSPVYTQVFEPRLGFIPDLSIIDLLFAEGKNTKQILEKCFND